MPTRTDLARTFDLEPRGQRQADVTHDNLDEGGKIPARFISRLLADGDRELKSLLATVTCLPSIYPSDRQETSCA